MGGRSQELGVRRKEVGGRDITIKAILKSNEVYHTNFLA
jgi:hypothetical protein